MEALCTAVLIGQARDWPDHLDEELRGSGFEPTHAASVHHVALLATHSDVRAIVVDARFLGFGDLVALHRLRTRTPRVALVVVGIGAISAALKTALDADATAFVGRSQLPAMLIDVLRSSRTSA